MKKILLSFVMFVAMTAVFAQSVPRNMVVMEVGTGTWCTYCPGAAMGADDLLENGKFVAVVENHNGDTYANTYSNARNSFYGISGYPTATFDGNQAVVGGNHSSSMYPNYLPKYNAAIAVPSAVDMVMDITNAGLDYTATITLTKVDNVTAASTKLMFAVTQSNIMQNWQGQTHLEHVNRLMVPDQNGTVVSFAAGNVQTVTLNFSLLPAWPVEDCEFVCWLQNYDAGQGNCPGTTVKKWTTLNGLKRGAIDLTPGFTASTTAIGVGQSVTFTNETTGGYIGTPETYEWSFQGGTPSTSTDQNPVVTYSQCGTFDATLIVNRGGQIDTLSKTAYIQVGTPVNVVADPGFTSCWYQTITLDATTPGATAYLWMPGGATTPTIDVTYAQYGIGAHDFTVTVTANGCETTKDVTATLDACTGISDNTNSIAVSVFPNPSNGSFNLEINTAKTIMADLTISNSLGMTVYTEKALNFQGKTIKGINLPDLSSGFYTLTLQSGDQRIVRKVIVK
jgi:PKD repeat protein